MVWGRFVNVVGEVGGMGFGNGVGCLCVQPDAGTLQLRCDAMQ